MTVTSLKRTRAAPARCRSPAEYPGYLDPCGATNKGGPPSGKGYAHEIKYDGFRSQIHIRAGKVTIYSSGRHDWTDRYRSIAEQAARFEVTHAVLDCEIVALREDGTCDFFALQSNVRASDSERLTAFAFDIMYLDGDDVRRRPYLERKALLAKVLENAGNRIRFVDYVETDGATCWTHAHNVNVEGIVSKPLDSTYLSNSWVKTPCRYRETLLVCGMSFDENRFGGLYLARRRGEKLIYAGLVDDGFSDEAVAEVRARLEPLIVSKQPVQTTTPKPDARWVQPTVRINVVHRGGLTADRVRRGVFEGFCEDPVRFRRVVKASSPSPKVPSANIQRLLADAEVPTAARLKAHWRKHGKAALEHIGRRPLTLVRHVDGVTFFHHGPLPETAASVHKLEIRKADGTRGTRLWVDSVQGLIDLVDIGAVELHPWAATVDDIERPDTLILDLDPGEGIGWDFVAETALAVRDLLLAEGLDCWPKLTGGAGVHLMAPIERELTHKEVHRYALDLAGRIAARKPAKYTTISGASRRVGKLFIDHLRNGRGFTAIGTYSPRARAGLPVAVPTTWKAIERGVRPIGLQLQGSSSTHSAPAATG